MTRRRTSRGRRPRVRHAAAAALVALLAGPAVGCASRAAHATYRDEAVDLDLVQTAAVLPFINLTSDEKAAERVRNVFSTMLQATGRVTVSPPGEIAKSLGRAGATGVKGEEPTLEVITNVGKAVQAEVVIVGTLLEYGPVRSGNSQANAIAFGVRMYEVESGRMIWTGSTTAGGVTASDRFFGGGGEPMEVVTEEAVKDLLDRMFR